MRAWFMVGTLILGIIGFWGEQDWGSRGQGSVIGDDDPIPASTPPPVTAYDDPIPIPSPKPR